MKQTYRKTTIKDVAAHAGVSIGTVSRVLANNNTVQDEIREKVNHSIRCLGYKPNLAARALRSNKVDVLGLIVPDITNPYFAQLAKEVEREASKHGLALILSSSHNDENKEQKQFSAIVDHAPTGIIIIPAKDGSALPQSHNIPLMALDRPITNLDGAFANQIQGAALAADHIFELGHRHVAYIAGPEETIIAQQRQKGFCDRFTALCGNLGYDLDVYHSEFSFDSGEKAASDILNRSQKTRPTAIVAASDTQAIGALRKAVDLGIEVPVDLTIIGFDDITLANIVSPRLTTIRQPAAKLAVEAVLRIVHADNHMPEHDFPCELIVRHSSVPPHGNHVKRFS